MELFRGSNGFIITGFLWLYCILYTLEPHYRETVRAPKKFHFFIQIFQDKAKRVYALSPKWLVLHRLTMTIPLLLALVKQIAMRSDLNIHQNGSILIMQYSIHSQNFLFTATDNNFIIFKAAKINQTAKSRKSEWDIRRWWWSMYVCKCLWGDFRSVDQSLCELLIFVERRHFRLLEQVEVWPRAVKRLSTCGWGWGWGRGRRGWGKRLRERLKKYAMQCRCSSGGGWKNFLRSLCARFCPVILVWLSALPSVIRRSEKRRKPRYLSFRLYASSCVHLTTQ